MIPSPSRSHATGAGFVAGAAALLALGGGSAGAQPADTGSARTLECRSEAGDDRQYCAAGTSAGVALLRQTGSAACLLGNNWGYDAEGVWVADGCSGEFMLGETAATTDPAASAEEVVPQWAQAAESFTWGDFDPGNGFLIGRSDIGSLSISAYAMVRYMNQDGSDTFIDHNGAEQPVDLRHDIYSHRVLVWLKGWIGLEKLIYTITLWTVNPTDQDAIFANIGYKFSDKFNLFAGVFGNPGSRSMHGSHPYWLGHDRVMADEFFRAYFTQGIYANGEVLPGFWYSASVGNNNSILGTTASQLDRKLTTGGSLWWMPTTHEFGPRGAYGDWEMHEELATRFGISYTDSPEQRYTDPGSNPQNTSLRLTDSTNLFATGALAPGVTIESADYSVFAIDAGFKYRGIFVQAEYFTRELSGLRGNGVVPIEEIVDTGLYLQGSFFAIPQKLEFYAATSRVYGDDDHNIGDASEILVGLNFYPANSRNHRLNFQVNDVERSPVSSTFGYYTAGQDGTTISTAFSVFF